MISIVYSILHNSVAMPEVFEGDNNSVEIVLDFTGTPYESWVKYLEAHMPDETDGIYNLGTDVIVTKTLTNANTKVGDLIINAVVRDGLGARKGFALKTIPVGDQLMISAVTEDELPDIITYIDQQDALLQAQIDAITLADLADVQIVGLKNGDVLAWDETQQKFENSDQLNFKITPEGGYAIKVINRTGAPSIKGYAVTASDTYDNAVRKIVVDVPNPIGIIYDSGVADGSSMWVVVAGIADAYFQNAPTRAYLARGFVTGDTGYVSGQLKSEAGPTAPFATDKHFYELGHILETKGVEGLAKMVLHFN